MPNWGCIPSKALLNSAETMESIRGAAKEHGIEVGEVKVDFVRVIKRSREAADKLSKGVRFFSQEQDRTIRGQREYRGAQQRRTCPSAWQTGSGRAGNRGRAHPDRHRLGRTAASAG